MKLKTHFLVTTITSLLFSGSVLAVNMPTVKINGNARLTYPANTSPACINDLVKNGCGGQGCSVGGKTLKFKNCTSISLTLQGGSGSCSNSQAELHLSTSGSTYDISLVNGYNTPVSITGGGTSIHARSQSDISTGVYPYGCSKCTSRTSRDCGYKHKGTITGCQQTANCQITNDGSKSYVVTFGG